jgi:hypothetical protein
VTSQLLLRRAASTPSSPTPAPNKETKDKEGKKSFLTSAFNGLQKFGAATKHLAMHPQLIPGKLQHLWHVTKHELNHYWLGTKLLWEEIKMMKEILKRVLQGHSMTRRERMHLIRTTQDLFRLVPFMIFVIVPFMEFTLPFFLKMFPNMLPSTFQDALKREESLKKELAMRLAVADFMQEALHSMAKAKRSKSDAAGAEEVIEFFEKAKYGEPLSNNTVIRMARLFKDELTLENISRPQLVNMCQFMKLNFYGSDSFLRFQLRTKINQIKEDDRRILWEGIESLNEEELKDACHERGMRSSGLSNYAYQNQLKNWIDLSINKNIPISLLVMSRAFVLSPQTLSAENVLRDSLSSLDSEVINEVVLEVAAREHRDSVEIRQRKLESLEFQREMIKEEIEDSTEAAAKKQQQQQQVAAKLEAKQTLAAESIPVAEVESALIPTAVMPSVPKDEVVGSRIVGGQQLETDRPAASVPTSPEAPSSSSLPGASAAPTPMDSSSPKVIVAELQLLDDIARGSVVSREKEMLALIKAKIAPVAPPRRTVEEGETDGEAGVGDLQTGAAAQPAPQDSSRDALFAVTTAASSKSEQDTVTASGAALSARSAEVPVPSVSAAPSSGQAVEEDAGTERMRKVLDKMLSTIQQRIAVTEKELAPKVQLLDTDKDGVVSSAELKEAVKKVLKRYPTEEQAEELVRILDTDKDGVGEEK